MPSSPFPAIALMLSASACFSKLPSRGGGEISKDTATAEATRAADPSGIAVPPGYRIELVADQLTFPTGVAFGDDGEIYVVESGYSYGDVVNTPRILDVPADGRGEPQVVYQGDSHAPWNGIATHGDAIFVAQGGQKEGGRVVRIDREGELTVLVDGLPSLGDHHTNGPVISDDGWVYFGQGAVTNAGVVGLDGLEFGWLNEQRELADVPCKDVTLSGVRFESDNPFTTAADDKAATGAYLPFGTPGGAGQVIAGKLPCNGAVMRVPVDGGDLELVAWGFRNPYGLAFDAAGALHVTDNGYDVRGNRPVFGSADMLWRVDTDELGRWHGFPDYADGRPLTWDFYAEGGGAPKGFLLAEHPGKVPEPEARLPVHSSADGFDFSRTAVFGHQGSAFVALFGDMAPTVGKVLVPVGFSVVRVDPDTGHIEVFARNEGDLAGPASKVKPRGLERPIAVRFDPAGTSLYVVDFGILRMTETGPKPEPGTGKLWRITREDRDAE